MNVISNAEPVAWEEVERELLELKEVTSDEIRRCVFPIVSDFEKRLVDRNGDPRGLRIKVHVDPKGLVRGKQMAVMAYVGEPGCRSFYLPSSIQPASFVALFPSFSGDLAIIVPSMGRMLRWLTFLGCAPVALGHLDFPMCPESPNTPDRKSAALVLARRWYDDGFPTAIETKAAGGAL